MSPFSSEFPGKLGNALDRLWQAVQRQKVIAGHGLRTEELPGGVAVHLINRPPDIRRAELTELRYLRVAREGWLALECYDEATEETLIVMKPDAIARWNGLSLTATNFAGHPLTAEAETDTGTWPVGDGFFLKVRHLSAPGEDYEYHRQVVWPPYIAEADSLSNGSRVNSGGTPYAYVVAAKKALSFVGLTVDDATLAGYDAGAPVGAQVAPEWTDINADARSWRGWSEVGNVLTTNGLNVFGE